MQNNFERINRETVWNNRDVFVDEHEVEKEQKTMETIRMTQGEEKNNNLPDEREPSPAAVVDKVLEGNNAAHDLGVETYEMAKKAIELDRAGEKKKLGKNYLGLATKTFAQDEKEENPYKEYEDWVALRKGAIKGMFNRD